MIPKSLQITLQPLSDRRTSASAYSKRIKVIELYLQENEFNELFES